MSAPKSRPAKSANAKRADGKAPGSEALAAGAPDGNAAAVSVLQRRLRAGGIQSPFTPIADFAFTCTIYRP